MSAAPRDCTTCPKCAPCGREPCYQCRDNCGWPTLAECDKCTDCRIGCLEIALEGSWGWYGNPDGILGEVVAGNTAQLNWNDLDYGNGEGQFGGRLTVNYRFRPYHRLEFRGAYYGNPEDSVEQSGFFGATPGALGTGDLSRPVNANFSADAEAFSVELNCWNEESCEGRWRTEHGLGLRFVNFDENARVDFVTTGPGPFPVANGFVESEVSNQFFGLQCCWAAHYDVSHSAEIYFVGKGLLGQINRDADVTDDSIFAGGVHTASASDDEIVWGADVEVGARYRINSRIGVTGGVNFLILDNVQRAEDAMDFSHSTTGAVQARNNPDQLTILSVYLGVTVTF